MGIVISSEKACYCAGLLMDHYTSFCFFPVRPQTQAWRLNAEQEKGDRIRSISGYSLRAIVFSNRLCPSRIVIDHGRSPITESSCV